MLDRFVRLNTRLRQNEKLSFRSFRIYIICFERRLREEGTTFQEVLQHTRVDLAQLYRSRREIPIGEISHLLGFSQSTAFHRAFRRWTGVTPHTFRRTLLKAGG